MIRETARFFPLLFIALLAACDQSFYPIQESDRHFSIYGVLDATADTQWIRAMPVRDTVFTSAQPVGVTAELARLGSDHRIVLRDSLFHFRSPNPDETADLYVHNFWTAEPIEPGATYRLTVTGPEGRSASAEIPVPELIDSVTVLISQGQFNQRYTARDYVRVDADHVALIQVVHIVPRFEVPTVVVYAGRGTDGRIRGMSELKFLKRYTGFPTEFDPPPINICLEPTQAPCEIRVVASGGRWGYDPLLSDEAVGALDAISNVTNGVGFVGGITQTKVPYERCAWKAPVPFAGGPFYCELTYAPRSATLSGEVRDITCGGKLLREGVVVLTDVAGPYIRTSPAWYTGGFYSIGALDGGATYQYRVSATADFIEEEGTVVLAAGEKRTMHFELRRKLSCPTL